MEIKKWNEREQRERDQAFFSAEVIRKELPGDPQRQRRCQYRQQIVGPVGDRKYCKPTANDDGGKRRMFGKAESKIARPGDQLGHVRMQILVALGDDAVKRPYQEITAQYGEHRAVSPHRIVDRVDQTVKRSIGNAIYCRKLHKVPVLFIAHGKAENIYVS